ncbi:MAG: bifunctional 2-polyprenyl-6-hydroxyphenol methylase/3-demethylubiquinol 3-O-methyltransferase UbiG [Gammaproteobacteria bacterium]|nr:bifunctional 2-polyprenyl-6-hydroxyphenol methylase/3-demethylubiquinol 3-O-methyltransferase UbiG [Gammaproteobacteria bacterium]
MTTVNVDHAELAKFEALASRWWDPSGEFKPLHDINPLRLEFIAQRVSLAGKRVLDVGCGGGILAESMATAGASVTGLDMAEGPLAVARHHLENSGLDIDYQRCTAEEWAAEHDNEYDVVTCLELLEHVPEPASTLHACAQLVKPGGHVFVSTINRNPKSWLFAIVGAEYVLRLLPRGTHEYAKFIRPSELEHWGHVSALTLRELIGMQYNPVTQRYTLGPGVDVNYLAHMTMADG